MRDDVRVFLALVEMPQEQADEVAMLATVFRLCRSVPRVDHLQVCALLGAFRENRLERVQHAFTHGWPVVEHALRLYAELPAQSECHRLPWRVQLHFAQIRAQSWQPDGAQGSEGRPEGPHDPRNVIKTMTLDVDGGGILASMNPFERASGVFTSRVRLKRASSTVENQARPHARQADSRGGFTEPPTTEDKVHTTRTMDEPPPPEQKTEQTPGPIEEHASAQKDEQFPQHQLLEAEPEREIQSRGRDVRAAGPTSPRSDARQTPQKRTLKRQQRRLEAKRKLLERTLRVWSEFVRQRQAARREAARKMLQRWRCRAVGAGARRRRRSLMQELQTPAVQHRVAQLEALMHTQRLARLAQEQEHEAALERRMRAGWRLALFAHHKRRQHRLLERVCRQWKFFTWFSNWCRLHQEMVLLQRCGLCIRSCWTGMRFQLAQATAIRTGLHETFTHVLQVTKTAEAFVQQMLAPFIKELELGQAFFTLLEQVHNTGLSIKPLGALLKDLAKHDFARAMRVLLARVELKRFDSAATLMDLALACVERLLRLLSYFQTNSGAVIFLQHRTLPDVCADRTTIWLRTTQVPGWLMDAPLVLLQLSIADWFKRKPQAKLLRFLHDTAERKAKELKRRKR